MLVHFGALLFDTSTQLLTHVQIDETIKNHIPLLWELRSICLWW